MAPRRTRAKDLRRKTGYLDTKACESHSRALDQRKGKRIDADFYVKSRDIAIKRAQALAKRHNGNQTEFPHDNPSTGFHELVLAITPKKR